MHKTIYFIRHGETDFNKHHIVQGGGIDSDLNATGIAQADRFFKQYNHIPFEVVLTSRQKRTHQTVEPFLQQDIRWEQFEQINEMGWGIYEGKKSTPAMREDYAQLMQEWKNGNPDARLDTGESLTELADRLQWFVDHLRGRQEKQILVCTHGRAMRCLMCLLDNQNLSQMEKYTHSNTGLYLVKYSPPTFQLIEKNNTDHLTTN